MVLDAQTGESVLLVSPANADQESLLKAKTAAVDLVGDGGRTALEVLERVAEAPLEKSSYNRIYSNVVGRSVSVHSPAIVSRYLATLAANGSLVLSELVLFEKQTEALCPITRQASDIVSLLKLSGFVDVTVESVEPVTDEALADLLKMWAAVRVEQGVQALSGKLGVARIVAKKPGYEVGQKVALNFGKKKNKNVWTVKNDDDEELEDADALLDEEDKAKPSKESLTRPDDCEMTGGRRKACKNCTCGRAEAEQQVVSLDLTEDDEQEVVEVDPTPKAVSGCGSCALGDAFRCSTCPYLGMPAFNPGEKVTLGGMFGKDDIDI